MVGRVRRGWRRIRGWNPIGQALFWLGTAVVTGAIAVTVAVFVYIHFIEGPPPKKLTLDATPTNAAAGAPLAAVDGTWALAGDSQVGYRVKEVLFGQSTTAVGRTSDVTGEMAITGTTISTATFTAQMSTVRSDQGNRDSQFRGRIMDVDKFPTATFVMTKPVSLGTVPDANVVANYKVSGKLTLHGVTRDVTVDLVAKRVGATILVNGQIPITFADYSVDNPSGGPASVGDTGTLEVLLVFTKKS